MTAMAELPGSNVEETGGSAEYRETQKIDPIPVQVVGSERQRAARYRSTFTISTINNTDLIVVQRILAQAPKRHRAIISSRPLATLTIPSVTANTNPQPAVPASTTAQANFFQFPVSVTVTGGTVSAIAVNGAVTGLTSGTVVVPPGGTITLTYTVAPTWTWVMTTPGGASIEATEFVIIGSEEQVMNGKGYNLYNGESKVIESTSALFLGPGTNPPTHTVAITVMDERFE